MNPVRSVAILGLSVVALLTPADAADYRFRARGLAASEKAAGAGDYKGLAGITNDSLNASLLQVLGTAERWKACGHRDGSCVGASETLVVFTQVGTGTEFGIWTKSDLQSNTGCWVDLPGFMFTTSEKAPAPILDGTGKPNASGTIQVCRNEGTMPLTNLRSDGTIGWASRGNWNTGYTVTGGSDMAQVFGKVAWYRR